MRALRAAEVAARASHVNTAGVPGLAGFHASRGKVCVAQNTPLPALAVPSRNAVCFSVYVCSDVLMCLPLICAAPRSWRAACRRCATRWP